MNLFVKNLTVIDISYLCHQRGLVGDSWILDISLAGELNEMSMVLDFGRVKKEIKQLVDREVDHRLLVPTKNDAIHYSEIDGDYATVDLIRENRSIHLLCPNQAYCLVDTDTINIQNVKDYLYELIKKALPDNVTGLNLNLRHEEIEGAFYHYSHGLKKHDGNCQRIAHGHRSPIEVLVNGHRDASLELEFADRWRDIYLGSQEDQVNLSELTLSKGSSIISSESHYGFKYTAPQGNFELAISKDETEILPTDTTIELLVNFIADEIKTSLNIEQTLEVIAYEGVGKGAIATR